MATVYKYLTSGRTVEHVDENDEYKPEDIKAHWAATFPELSNATWDEGKDEEGRRVVTFAKKVGTKGSEAAAWPQWISVEERLPEADCPVLIGSNIADFFTIGFRSEVDGSAYWEVDEWLDGHFDYQLSDYITHWIPLPCLPPENTVEPEGEGYMVQNFVYNGFSGRGLRGLTNYRAQFIEWTTDPGVAVCDCTDGEQRLIPTFALVDFEQTQHPTQAKTGVCFGEASRS